MIGVVCYSWTNSKFCLIIKVPDRRQQECIVVLENSLLYIRYNSICAMKMRENFNGESIMVYTRMHLHEI